MAKQTAHGYDLALVMKGVAKDVMKHEGRSADVDVSVVKAKFGIGVELLFGYCGQIGQSLFAYLLLQEPGLADISAVVGGAALERKTLQDVDPVSLAIEDVNYLLLNGGTAEPGKFPGVVASGKLRQMIEQ